MSPARTEPDPTTPRVERVERRRATASSIARGVIKTMRVRQWVKNVFVLAPLFFSGTYTEPERLALASLAALLFSLMAGTVYLINDLLDVEKDRNHPLKRRRPIASGELPPKAAAIASCAIAAVTLSVAWAIAWPVGACLTAYFAMNLAYSVSLKNVVYLDVVIIAAGFVLRVIAGAVAIQVFISEWILACTFLLTLYMALGKRLHELQLIERGEVKGSSREVLKRYREASVSFIALFVAGLTIASYTIYTLTAALPEQPLRSQHTPFSSPMLLATIPCTVFGITRFHALLHSDSLSSPTEQILHDKSFIANLVLWIGLMIYVAFTL